jgi:hypothetical protein
MRAVYSIAIVFLSLFPRSAAADTFYPMLMSIGPVAVQQGSTSECEVSGRYSFRGAYKVFVTGDGVAGEVDPPKIDPKATAKPQLNKLKVRFKVAADALPGVREVRVATPQGVSTVGQLVVVVDPVVREAANNDTMKTAQEIAIPATACGRIEKAEDVDYFKFKVPAGQALTFHVRSMRLQDRIHDLQEHADPILTLKNSSGTVLAMNDNYFAADPLLHYKFALAGEYYLEIRDARYGGNADWQYSIEINDRPFVTNIHPMRLTPGRPTRVEMIGYNLEDAFASLTLPPDTPAGPRWIVLPLAGGKKTNSVPVVVSNLPEVLESAGEHGSASKALPVAVPSGICGRLENEGEVDCYSFAAKAGEKFAFQILARELQSALDPVIRISNDKGQLLLENDDFRDRFVHPDSRIESWAAPANGRYVVEVKDVHLRGGPAFVYHLQITRPEPTFTLELDTDKTLLAPGTASVIFVRAARKNGFEGEVELSVEGLPAGVTAKCGRILSTGKDGCIHLQAAADAKIDAANIRVIGTATIPGPKPTKRIVPAAPLQEIYMPGGGRYHYSVQTHTVSVGDPLDIRSVKLSTTDIVLKPGESKRIEVAIERAPNFKQNVTLDVVYQHLGGVFGDSLPPGVTLDDKASLTLLTGDQSKGFITLKAAPDAKPVEKQQAVVMAHVSINFVMKFTYCGEPILVTVAKP